MRNPLQTHDSSESVTSHSPPPPDIITTLPSNTTSKHAADTKGPCCSRRCSPTTGPRKAALAAAGTVAFFLFIQLNTLIFVEAPLRCFEYRPTISLYSLYVALVAVGLIAVGGGLACFQNHCRWTFAWHCRVCLIVAIAILGVVVLWGLFMSGFALSIQTSSTEPPVCPHCFEISMIVSGGLYFFLLAIAGFIAWRKAIGRRKQLVTPSVSTINPAYPAAFTEDEAEAQV